MLSFRLTKKASEDLIGIARYTETAWGRKQRNYYLKQLDAAFHALAENPDIGHSCNEIRQGYFKYRKDSQVIFYRLGTESTIEIIRVLHKRMDTGLHL